MGKEEVAVRVELGEEGVWDMVNTHDKFASHASHAAKLSKPFNA